MPEGSPLLLLVSLLLLLGSAFFVAAEYSLVSSRRSRLEALGKRGDRRAKALARALGELPRYVATSQIGITMLGVGVGSVTEPYVTALLVRLAGGAVDVRVSYAVAFLLVSLALVVVGELVPKYATLRNPEHAALLLFPPLRLIGVLLAPLTWFAETAAGGLLRVAGVRPAERGGSSVPKEELLLLVQAGEHEGELEKRHAELVSRALRLDVLTARDIMVHRLDVKWLDVNCPRDRLLAELKRIPYTRIPVCDGDIDDLKGVVYLHDLVRLLDAPNFDLGRAMGTAVIVPENLPVERILDAMREAKSQIVVVIDEYGGTSGIVTLEDVVEEVFGELEDRIETQRPLIEVGAGGRVSARAEVRFDEVVRELGLPLEPGENTDTLATMVVERLERIPRTGDTVETELGTMRVENMARNRITRVAIWLTPALRAPSEEGD